MSVSGSKAHIKVRGNSVFCRRRNNVCGYIDIDDGTVVTRFTFPSDYPGPYPTAAYRDPKTGEMVIDKVQTEVGSDEEGDYTEIIF